MVSIYRSDDGRHGIWDDVQAIAMGTFFAAVGIEFFRDAHLGTGGTAGVAFLIHYVTQFGIGPVIFLLNLPFYVFGWVTLGAASSLLKLAISDRLSVTPQLRLAPQLLSEAKSLGFATCPLRVSETRPILPA